MKRIAQAALATFFCAPALAADPTPYSLLPPAEFDRPHPNLRIWLVGPEEVDAACRRFGFGTLFHTPYRIGGCAEIGDGKSPCNITLPRGHSEEIFRHEQAHCNGWRHE